MSKWLGYPLLLLVAGFATFMVFITDPIINSDVSASGETCAVTDLASAVTDVQVQTAGTVERKVVVLDQPEGS